MNSQPIILIVDDEPANIEILAGTLEAHFEVHFASTGQEALERVVQEPIPDLILLDVMMPDLDGYAVCARLKENRATAGLPVIFVTALGDPHEEERGLNAGAVDYITKPFSPAIVLARVRTHLRIVQTTMRLQHLAITDSLTNLTNRRNFDVALAHEIELLGESQKSLSLVLLDLDHFKDYNDHYGHPAGDECLRLVSSAVSQAVRPTDLCARIGGEEFAFLLRNTGIADSLVIAERIRLAILNLNIVHAASRVLPHVTASLGVATTSACHEEAALALYRSADAALYRAKTGGRNQIAT